MQRKATVIYCDVCQKNNVVVFEPVADNMPDEWLIGLNINDNVSDICPNCVETIVAVAKYVQNECKDGSGFDSDKENEVEPDREPGYFVDR